MRPAQRPVSGASGLVWVLVMVLVLVLGISLTAGFGVLVVLGSAVSLLDTGY